MPFVIEDALPQKGRFVFEDDIAGLSAYAKDAVGGITPAQGISTFRPSAAISGVRPLQPSYPSPLQKSIIENIKGVGGAAVGQAESAAQLLGGLATFPVQAGIAVGAGAGTLVSGGSLDEAAQNIEGMQSFVQPYLVYEPRTAAGKRASESINKFLDWLIHKPAGTAGEMAATGVEALFGKTAGAAAGAGVETALNFAGYAALLGGLSSGSRKIGLVKEKIAARKPLTAREARDFEEHLKETARMTKGFTLPPEDVLNALTGRTASESAVGYVKTLSSWERSRLAKSLIKKQEPVFTQPAEPAAVDRGLALPQPEIQTTMPSMPERRAIARPVSSATAQLDKLAGKTGEIGIDALSDKEKIQLKSLREIEVIDALTKQTAEERMAGSDAVAIAREKMVKGAGTSAKKGRFVIEGAPPVAKVEAVQAAVAPDPLGIRKKVEPAKAISINTTKTATVKQQKSYLLSAIDTAIKEAPVMDYDRIKKVQTKDITDKEQTPMVTIKVPDDGLYNIINDKLTLMKFRNMAAKQFPGGVVRGKVADTVKTAKTQVRPLAKRPSLKTGADFESVEEYKPRAITDTDYLNPKDKKRLHEGNGWFGDGHYILKGEPPAKFKGLGTNTILTEDNVKATSTVKALSPAKIKGEVHLSGDSFYIVLIGSNKTDVAVDARYVDVILKHHPEAVPLVKDAQTQVVWTVDGEPVAALMPLNATRVHIPTVKRLLAEHDSLGKNEKVAITRKFGKGETGAISLHGMPTGIGQKFIKGIREFFEPTSTMPESDEYKLARYRKYGWADRTERLARHTFGRLNKLSPAVRWDMFDFLDGKKKITELPSDARPVAQSLQTANNMISRMLLKRGKISMETYIKHKNNYVRYFYTEHLAEKGNANAIVKGNRIDPTAFEARIDPKIIENLGGKEYLDKAVYEGLLKVAESIGVKHRRVNRAGRGKLGYAEKGTGRIVTQYATELSVLAHEIGHQLDFKYGLWDRIVRGAEGVNERTGKITQKASSAKRYTIQKELRVLTDLFFKGSEDFVSEYTKKKVRAKAEKLARMLETYIHAPEQFKSIAPTVYEVYDKFLESRPELRPLRGIKPEIALKMERPKGYQVVSQGGKPYSKPFLTLKEATAELAKQEERVALLRKEMGFIEDVAIAQPLGMANSLMNIGNIDFFQTVAENPKWTWQPSMVEIGKDANGKPIMMGIGKLADEVATAAKTYKELPDSPEVKARFERMQDALDSAIELTKNVPDEFYRMPNSAAYGELAGAFVRKEIAKDILSLIPHGAGRLAELSHTLDVVAKIEAKGMAAFKVSKTALNVPTLIRNFVSNPFQMMMDGVHPWEIFGALLKAARSWKAHDGDFHASLKRGVFKTNMSVTELNEVLDVVGAIGPNPSYYDIVGQLMKLTKFYGHIDDLFKHASYIHWKGKGLSADQSSLQAQDTGMDYSLAHPVVKAARKHVIPFATFSYKMIPKIVRTLRYRPWIIAGMLALPSILTEISLRTLNLTKEEYKELMASMPSLVRKGMYVIVPWRSAEGDVQWVDIEYFLPIQSIVKAIRDTYRGSYGEAIKDTGIGGPFIDILTIINTARGDKPPENPFTGQPIFNVFDTPTEKSIKLSEWLYNEWMPTMLTRQGFAGYMDRYKEGQKDKYGRTVTLPQATGRLLGVNIIAPTKKQGRVERAARLLDAQASFKKAIRDNPDMTQEELKELRIRYKRKKQEIMGSPQE